jgi:hypothetical protein
VKQFLHNLALLCALLPQFLLATLAPALVMCQEANGAQVLELALSECCDAPATNAETDEPGAHEQEEDCEGCTDSAVPMTLKRDEAQQPAFVTPVFLQASPAWSWNALAPPQRLALSEPVPNAALQALRTVNIRC